jgi:hypothetical protein
MPIGECLRRSETILGWTPCVNMIVACPCHQTASRSPPIERNLFEAAGFVAAATAVLKWSEPYGFVINWAEISLEEQPGCFDMSLVAAISRCDVAPPESPSGNGNQEARPKD